MINNTAMQILQQMPAFRRINPLINMLQNAQNPMALLKQQFGNDPAFQRAMETVKGKSPQEIEQFAKNMFFTQTNVRL